MPLLYDQLMWDTIGATSIDRRNLNQATITVLNRNLREELGMAEVFDVSNVAEFFWSVSDLEYDDPDQDFPNIAPPFERFWMEYRLPQTIRSKDGDRAFPLSNMKRIGVYFESPFVKPKKSEDDWVYAASVFITDSTRTVIGPILHEMLVADPNGKPLSGKWKIGVTGPPRTEIEDAYIQEAQLYIKPCLLALSFMHCRNVNAETKTPDPKLSRAHRRRHGRELITYHTLAIDPMKKVLESEGGLSESGLRKALHICRGHFSYYGERYGKGKLFGKHEGQFWVPSHVRGSVSAGIADKDYAIRTPVTTAQGATR